MEVVESKKLKTERIWLTSLKADYENENDNEIYDRLYNIASMKYLKGDDVKVFQEDFFVDFVVNGHAWNNYDNLYNSYLHKKLILRRRKLDPNFLIHIDVDRI